MNCVVTQEDIMKKLHTLRSQFRKEMKDMKASHKSGAGLEDICYNNIHAHLLLDSADETENARALASWQRASSVDAHPQYCLATRGIPRVPSPSVDAANHLSPQTTVAPPHYHSFSLFLSSLVFIYFFPPPHSHWY